MFKKNNGFTLIELMVTIVVLGIILAIAVPSFDSMIKNYRLQSVTNQLIDSFNLARNTALSRNQVITIEASGTTEKKEWNGGWVVKVGAEEIRVFEGVSGVVTINATNTGAGTNIKEIAFSGNGRLSAPNTGAEFTVTDDRSGVKKRVVNVNLSGQTRITLKD
ncbi:GspH/FimT family pseudopilin [Zooshikella harenae]|uniref:Type II secretion system protein H n=1 Tax=Zooshikella harenae TaxID=2827238 RepID=A0ABS5ZB57_9GAMM|nr:GspH/FimT family pseudopilin [Zooshikella harenae]MBU2710142.1 GspH/FimT family pseudopilin [Zooshikella harenae]